MPQDVLLQLFLISMLTLLLKTEGTSARVNITMYCNSTDSEILQEAKKYLESEDMAQILLRKKGYTPSTVFPPLRWFDPQTVFNNLETFHNICNKVDAKWFLIYCANREEIRKRVADYWLAKATDNEEFLTRMDNVAHLRYLDKLELSRDYWCWEPNNNDCLRHICDGVSGLEIEEPLNLLDLNDVLGRLVTKDWKLITKTNLSFSDELQEEITKFNQSKAKYLFSARNS